MKLNITKRGKNQFKQRIKWTRRTCRVEFIVKLWENLNWCHSPEMEGKAIGEINCMNVCLSTVWSATAFWFTCMPLSNGPDTPQLTEYFYFWCFIVTSKRKSHSRCPCSKFFFVSKPGTCWWKIFFTSTNTWAISRNVSPTTVSWEETINLQTSWE